MRTTHLTITHLQSYSTTLVRKVDNRGVLKVHPAGALVMAVVVEFKDVLPMLQKVYDDVLDVSFRDARRLREFHPRRWRVWGWLTELATATGIHRT